MKRNLEKEIDELRIIIISLSNTVKIISDNMVKESDLFGDIIALQGEIIKLQGAIIGVIKK